MPILKKYDYSFDFRIELGSKLNPDKPLTAHYVYIKEGLLITVPIDPNDPDKTISEKTEYKPLMVHYKHGLMTWNDDTKVWSPLIDKFQEAYATIQAEKVLLGKEVPDASI